MEQPPTENHLSNQDGNENQQSPQTPKTPDAGTAPVDFFPETAQTPPAPPESPDPQNNFTIPAPNYPSDGQPRPPRKHIASTVLLIALIAVSVVSAASLYSVYTLNTQVDMLQQQIQTLASQLNRASTDITSAAYVSYGSLSDLYNAVKDSVVTIECTIPQTYINPFTLQRQSINKVTQGSGFIYQYNGQSIIITNNHVIESASGIKVIFADGSSYTATVIAEDASKDLAILKSQDAPASIYRPLTFADSSRVEVGDAAIAIGSPYGLSGTMTNGIISALDRTITVSEGTSSEISGVMQTSAPINSGNSGGPLLTLDGKVIGITTAIVRNSDGLGFAVPSNAILDFIQKTI